MYCAFKNKKEEYQVLNTLLRKFTCLSESSVRQQDLVFALRQKRYSNATADALHLVWVLAGLADGPVHLSHPFPVFLLGTKLTKWMIRINIIRNSVILRDNPKIKQN